MFNCATVLCYVCLWLVCRLKSSVRETSTKVLKSLTVITAVVLMGWTINAVVLTVSGSILKLDMVKLFFLELYFGINVLASCSANYLILYKFSSDYRSALRHQFSALIATFSRQPVVQNKSQTTVIWSSLSRNRSK
ncbi:serpentine type 7TM GPCR chemoreceptor srsx domain-containing protein [Ditylenchus destructor]|uniref:Serpentine type 7TM GPCR chemoreceptor srsx domain-containing protein n=1 Tax=Ditylenchus destructor TaxID=166010 RepID=A0AAD4N3U3_9BILA|nr:serpentine type 7TM GPCR chemoreceptor srsx domain-containing protein [Ditylenchus destructor]